MVANYSPCRCVTAASRCLLCLIRRPLILREHEGILVLMWNYWANILPTIPNTAPTYLLIYLVISHAIHRCHSVTIHLVTNMYLEYHGSVRAKDIPSDVSNENSFHRGDSINETAISKTRSFHTLRVISTILPIQVLLKYSLWHLSIVDGKRETFLAGWRHYGLVHGVINHSYDGCVKDSRMSLE